MLYISIEDFYNKVAQLPRITREQEKELACALAQGDKNARERIIENYLHHVAAVIRRSPKYIQTLKTVYSAIETLEQGVDTFNFEQDGETFAHHLSWRMRQCITRAIVERN